MHRFKIIAPLIVAGMLLAAYSNSFTTPFHYDDAVNILRNKSIHLDELTWEGVKGTWFAGGERGDIYHPILYRPVSMFSFAANYYLHGLSPMGFHIVNFAVHLTASLFLYFFICRLLVLPQLRTGNAPLIAFLSAAMWALNPVQLTSVTYIVQRMTSLAGMFYIAAMYFYLRARTGGGLISAAIAFICALLGVGSKENAIMVFAAVAIFDLMFFDVPGIKKRIAAYLWMGLIGILLVYAVQGYETFLLDKLQAGFAKRDFTLGQRLLTEPRVIVFYIMLLFFPSHNLLSLTHNVPVSNGLLSPPETLLSIVIIACIIGIGIIRAKRNPIISFAIFFFFLNHVIEGTIFPLELVYEHRNYVPSMFLFLPIAVLIVRGYERYGNIVAAAAACILIFFTVNTYQQNRVWKTDLALWEDVLKKSPDPRSMFNYGGAHYTKFKETGDKQAFDNAVKYFKMSRDFNQLFGTNYTESFKKIPYGRVMYMAQHNTKMLTMQAEGRIRPAWKLTDKVLKKMVIKKKAKFDG